MQVSEWNKTGLRPTKQKLSIGKLDLNVHTWTNKSVFCFRDNQCLLIKYLYKTITSSFTV